MGDRDPLPERLGRLEEWRDAVDRRLGQLETEARKVRHELTNERQAAALRRAARAAVDREREGAARVRLTRWQRAGVLVGGAIAVADFVLSLLAHIGHS